MKKTASKNKHFRHPSGALQTGTPLRWLVRGWRVGGVTAALPRRRAKTVGSWRSHACSREQMRVMLRLDKLPHPFWEAADREVEIAAGSLAKWAHLGIVPSCSSLGWSGSVGYSADASQEHRLSSPCAQREVSADAQIGFPLIIIIPGVIIIT